MTKEIVAGEPVSRILCLQAARFRAACSGDHSSRSRLAPRLQRPTRGLSSAMACVITAEQVLAAVAMRRAAEH
jgi:hypothetical protein